MNTKWGFNRWSSAFMVLFFFNALTTNKQLCWKQKKGWKSILFTGNMCKWLKFWLPRVSGASSIMWLTKTKSSLWLLNLKETKTKLWNAKGVKSTSNKRNSWCINCIYLNLKRRWGEESRRLWWYSSDNKSLQYKKKYC